MNTNQVTREQTSLQWVWASIVPWVRGAGNWGPWKKATQLCGIWQRECRSGRMQTRRGSEWQTGLSRICAPLISSGAASCHQKAHSGAEWLPIWRTSNTTVPAIKGRVLGTKWSEKNCTALRDRALLFKTNLFFCYSDFLCNSIVF